MTETNQVIHGDCMDILAGRDFILIEKEADYYEIAKARVEAAMNEPRQLDLLNK